MEIVVSIDAQEEAELSIEPVCYVSVILEEI